MLQVDRGRRVIGDSCWTVTECYKVTVADVLQVTASGLLLSVTG